MDDKLSRKIALLPIGVVFSVQFIYAVFVCDHVNDPPSSALVGVLLLFAVTAVLLIPAFLWLRRANLRGVFGACIGLLPWLIVANHAECVVPYEGGGATMAYVFVFLLGVPCSVLLGNRFARRWKKAPKDGAR